MARDRVDAKYWRQYFLDSGLPPELVDSYMRYVYRMSKANLPVIFEFRHLAALLGRTTAYLGSVVNCPNAHYRVFQIPKRTGGMREIAAPYPSLLQCQQWINSHVLSKSKLAIAAHGFVRGRSIATNASQHLGAECLLKMDLKDFFPSINKPRVIKAFRCFRYPSNVAFYLAQICCLNDVLPQGAATSPALSNLIAGRLDARLSGLSQRWGLTYSRYADDLSFSGHYISLNFPDIVEKIVNEEGFHVNPKKTRLCRSKGKRIVTGLSVSGDELKIPHHYKRKLRQEVHYILRFGYISHTSKKKIKDPFYLESVYGKLLFWKWIEPDNSFLVQALPRIQEMIKKSRFPELLE